MCNIGSSVSQLLHSPHTVGHAWPCWMQLARQLPSSGCAAGRIVLISDSDSASATHYFACGKSQAVDSNKARP